VLARIRSILSRGERDIVLLSKPGCELCQKAERAVGRVFGARRVRVVNILDDRALEDEYVFRIPVLIIDGAVVAEGLIGEEDARRAWRGALRGRGPR